MAALACLRDEKGGIVTEAVAKRPPGVYVAGDVSRDVLLIAVALAEGAKVAVAINRALLAGMACCDGRRPSFARCTARRSCTAVALNG